MLGWTGSGRSSSSMPEANPMIEVATVERHDPERLGRHRPTHRVEGHVDAPPIGHVVDEGDEVPAAVVHAVVGTQGAAEGNLVVGSGRGDHRRTERLGQLDGGRPGTAGRRVDEDDVTRAHPSPHAEREVTEQVREVHRDCLGRAEPLGDLLDVRSVEQGHGRVGTLGPRGHTDDPPPEQRLAPRTGRLDRAGGRHPDHEGGLELEQAVPAADGVDVVEVEAERLDLDPHLAGGRVADLDGLDLEGVGGCTQPG